MLADNVDCRHEQHGCANHGLSTGSPLNQQLLPFMCDAYARRRKRARRQNAIKRKRDQSLRPLEDSHQFSTTSPSTLYEHHRAGVSTVWEDLTTSGLSYHVPELQALGISHESSTTYWPATNSSVGHSLPTQDHVGGGQPTFDWNTLFDPYNG